MDDLYRNIEAAHRPYYEVIHSKNFHGGESRRILQFQREMPRLFLSLYHLRQFFASIHSRNTKYNLFRRASSAVVNIREEFLPRKKQKKKKLRRYPPSSPPPLPLSTESAASTKTTTTRALLSRFQRGDPVHPRCGNRSRDHPARLS